MKTAIWLCLISLCASEVCAQRTFPSRGAPEARPDPSHRTGKRIAPGEFAPRPLIPASDVFDPDPASSTLIQGNASQPEASDETGTGEKALSEMQKPRGVLLGQPVVYDGFVVEWLSAERPSRTFDLRQPVTETGPAENVVLYPNSNAPQGFALFRIRF